MHDFVLLIIAGSRCYRIVLKKIGVVQLSLLTRSHCIACKVEYSFDDVGSGNFAI
jgi:hypothetical protein